MFHNAITHFEKLRSLNKMPDNEKLLFSELHREL